MFKLTCTSPNETFQTNDASAALAWLHERGALRYMRRAENMKPLLRKHSGRMTFNVDDRTFTVDTLAGL